MDDLNSMSPTQYQKINFTSIAPLIDNCLAITNKRKRSLSTSNGYSEVICVIMTL